MKLQEKKLQVIFYGISMPRLWYNVFFSHRFCSWLFLKLQQKRRNLQLHFNAKTVIKCFSYIDFVLDFSWSFNKKMEEMFCKWKLLIAIIICELQSSLDFWLGIIMFMGYREGNLTIVWVTVLGLPVQVTVPGLAVGVTVLGLSVWVTVLGLWPRYGLLRFYGDLFWSIEGCYLLLRFVCLLRFTFEVAWLLRPY